MKLSHYDLIIIGAGAGGLSIAAVATQLDFKVALIEADNMGGDCLNSGCVPSKSLLAAAKTQWLAKQQTDLGVHAECSKPNFKQAMNHVKQTIQRLAAHDSQQRFEQLGATVIRGLAKFINKNTIEVNNTLLSAKRFIIATGSTPFIPPIDGLDKVNYLTNETIFDLTDLPKHLIVVGGGPIGCELAQAFSMLGSQVTVIDNFTILPKDESDCVDIIRQQMLAMDIQLLENTAIESIKQTDTGINIITNNTDSKVITGSHVLIATGRRANINHLNLEKADIEFNNQGIIVNKKLRTTNKKAYAIGDCIGSFQFTHMASYHASIVIKNILFKLPAKVNDKAVPWVTYTYPEVAHVGLTSQSADNKHISYMITELNFSENDRAQTESNIKGSIKILSNKKGKILGVTIVHAQAGELITPWSLAIQYGQTLRYFTDVIIPYPTLSEISKRAASSFYGPKLFSSKTKKLVHWLFKFG